MTENASARGKLTRNGTDGRVYGGDENLLHLPDGYRAHYGGVIAELTDAMFRGINGGDRESRLCPGCYMVAMYDAAVALAIENGQDLGELGRSMAAAFQRLADAAPGEPIEPFIESIEVR